MSEKTVRIVDIDTSRVFFRIYDIVPRSQFIVLCSCGHAKILDYRKRIRIAELCKTATLSPRKTTNIIERIQY